jgi:hypothetical protein
MLYNPGNPESNIVPTAGAFDIRLLAKYGEGIRIGI